MGLTGCFSFLGACYVLHVTFIFLKSSCAMGFQFPLPLLSSSLFEATSSPGAEFLFAFQNSFSMRSDPVKDHLIYRRSFSFHVESNTDPEKSAVKVPLAPWSRFIFPRSQFNNTIKHFASFQVESTSHLGFVYGIQITPVPFTWNRRWFHCVSCCCRSHGGHGAAKVQMNWTGLYSL